MRNEKHLSSKLARDLSSLHSWFLDERELLHRHQQASEVTKMTCEAAPHSTACLLKSRCATRGLAIARVCSCTRATCCRRGKYSFAIQRRSASCPSCSSSLL